MTLSPARIAASVLVALATPCVVVAVAVLLFLNPVWVGFEQDRSDVAALTGYPPAEVHQVTGSILSDLVFGPPNFDVAVNGQPVLDPRERSHMADVRSVLLELGGVALVATAVLLIVGLWSRGRGWFWAAVRAGGRLTVAGVVVVGLGFALFFEQAFELFHEIFFAAGTYTFNLGSEKLVQLFPDQFWSETSVAIALAVLVLALGSAFGADRLAVRSLSAGRSIGGGTVATPTDGATNPTEAKP